jgi:hypothetical protein
MADLRRRVRFAQERGPERKIPLLSSVGLLLRGFALPATRVLTLSLYLSSL